VRVRVRVCIYIYIYIYVYTSCLSHSYLAPFCAVTEMFNLRRV
jgi:hypothetical protein